MRKTFQMGALVLICNILLAATCPQVVPPGKATVAKNWFVQLDNSLSLQEQYVADISLLNFESLKQAQEFFSVLEDPFIDFKINFQEKKVLINLHPSDSNGRQWTVERWNAYLKSKADYQNKMSN